METPVSGNRTCIYQAGQLDAVLDDMAWQAAAYFSGRERIQLVGILRRGVPLARMLQQRLRVLLRRQDLPLLELKVKRYADDLTLLHPETLLTEDPAHQSLDLSDTSVLVVDDVMYQGHSMLRTVQYLATRKAAEIRGAVLIDRGANTVPVRADITGVRLDIAPGDIIECCVPPYEPEFRIVLLQPIQA